jgi:hypothetical protein
MRRFSRRPSPAMAVAFIALLAALSGTAVALPGKNSVDSGDIKKAAVKRADIARNAVNGSKVQNGSLTGAEAKNDSLTGSDVNESTLGQVPSAATANSATTANTATSAGSVEGPDTKNLVSGYATINGQIAVPTVLNFGGKRVTSVTVSRVGLGIFDVTFNGNFPGVDSVEDVMFLVNIWDTDAAGEVAAASAGDSSTVSANQITTRVAAYNGATFIDREIAIVMMTP